DPVGDRAYRQFLADEMAHDLEAVAIGEGGEQARAVIRPDNQPPRIHFFSVPPLAKAPQPHPSNHNASCSATPARVSRAIATSAGRNSAEPRSGSWKKIRQVTSPSARSNPSGSIPVMRQLPFADLVK